MELFFVQKEWWQVHEVRSGAAEYTGRICVIGSRLEEDKLEALFGLKK